MLGLELLGLGRFPESDPGADVWARTRTHPSSGLNAVNVAADGGDK